MNNKLLCALIFSFCCNLSIAQHERCKTMQRHDHLMQSDVQYKQAHLTNEAKIQSFKNAKTAGTIYKIPVVVHVLHLGTSVGVDENISDEQIYSAIQSLNNAYRKKPGTAGDGNGVDTEIQFCLAQKDPSGNPHSGINRVNASSTSTYATEGITDANETTIKALSKWSNTKYYNIWVVSEIDDNDGQDGTQGYAYFPGASSSVDGAVMLFNAFGFDPDGSRGFTLKSYTNRNGTAIHEMGHAFRLYHTFQGDGDGSQCPTDADCGNNGDCVSDTPRHKRSDSDCIVGTNTCTGGSTNSYIHNYMDYSADACQHEFTAGQATRMRAALASGPRSSLVTASNLTACGCNGNTAPITLFSVENTQPCVGMEVQFIDESLNFPTAWSWTFAGGNPATSTLQNPSVVFSGTGPYTVTLTSTASGGNTDSYTKNDLITPSATVTTPISEGFEGSTFPPAGWKIVSTDALSEITWDLASSSGNGVSSQSAFVNCFDYNEYDQTDDLITPPISLDGITSPYTTFLVSYDQYDDYLDGLEVAVSSNCGSSWTTLYSKFGATLETTASKGSSYAPSLASHWRKDSVSLAGYSGTVLLRFRIVNDYGANVYLDDVLIKGTGYEIPVANFRASATVAQPGNAISFSDISTGVISSYSWDFGQDASLSAGTTGAGPHSVSYSTTGTKTVTLTVTNPDNESDVETKVAYIDVQTDFAVPTADFSANNTITSVNSSITFTSTSTGPVSLYNWDFGQDASLPAGTTGAGPHSVSYSTTGTKTVTLTVTNPDNESDVETKTAYITVTSATSLMNEQPVQHYFLYPNPAGRYVELKNVPVGSKVSFINSLGAVVKSSQSTDGTKQVDLSDLSNGLYTVFIQTGENIYSEKLMVQP